MKRKISLFLCVVMVATITSLLPTDVFAANTNFKLEPQTPYASEFIAKCGSQQWFINEVERLLNVEQKTLNTISDQSDLDVIKAIGLSGKNIKGKIPTAIGELRELRYLFLAGNQLSGEIPSELYALPKLQNIDLTDSDYSGNIPEEFGNMSALEILMLGGNYYSGEIPDSILNNKKIEVLDLHGNSLNGGVPSDLANMESLTYLNLSGNYFGGQIPDLSALSNLISLDLSRCRLEGEIPESIYSINKLQILNLGANKLSGGISESLNQLNNLQCLVLDDNKLRGELPDAFALDLSGEKPIVHLENNYFRGDIPQTLESAVDAGAMVYLDNNWMGGEALNKVEKFDRNFTDNASYQYKLISKQDLVQISQENTTDLYKFLENKPLFSTDESKSLLKPDEYSIECDDAMVQISVTEDGIYVQALNEILKDKPVPVIISILANDGVKCSSATINVTTEHVNYTTGGGGGSGPNLYSIAVKHGDGIRLNKENAKMHDRIEISVPMEQIDKINNLVVCTASGKNVEVSELGNGLYTFIMPAADVEIYVNEDEQELNIWKICPKNQRCPISKFADALPAAWYHDGVHYCLDQGLMNGTKQTKFAPDSMTSRGMIVTILYRLEGEPNVSDDMVFNDLTQDWYKNAVNWASENGIVNGFGKGRFEPDNPITREQFAAILYRYAQYKNYDTSVSSNLYWYTDVDKISPWALEGIKWANGINLLQGRTDTTLVPEGTTTRAEAATLIFRFCELIIK